MPYISREQMAIVQLKDIGEKSISMDAVKRVLSDYPSNMICCVSEGKLIGIVSTVDICRACSEGLEEVGINEGFIYILEGQRVRGGFSSFPVVTKDHILTGGYTKWEYPSPSWYTSGYGTDIKDRLSGKRIVLVRPRDHFEERKNVFERFYDHLCALGIRSECIEHQEVPGYLEAADMILFVEGNELQGNRAVLNIIYGKDPEGIDKMKTYRDLEDGVLELEQMLLEPYTAHREAGDKDAIMFWMPPFVGFVDGILPLMTRYLRAGNRCVVAIPLRQTLKQGAKMIKGMMSLIKKIVSMGGICHDSQDKELFCDAYDLCYLCSEYSGPVPLALRRKTKWVVALQTTSIYTHMYRIEGRFSEVFSEEQRTQIDHLITSDHMADWICRRAPKWDKKILRFGYPKLDAIYDALSKDAEIPEEWREKIQGKKVILCTSINRTLIDIIYRQEVAVLMRPHPQTLESHKDYIRAIRESYPDLIMDDMTSYYPAFQISDALISDAINSSAVNYLYTGKPVCFYDVKDRTPVIDFREEAWFKSAYTVSEKKDLVDILEMIVRGEDIRKQELDGYRRQVVSNFDGKVCDRIYDHFEKNRG